MSHTRLFYHLIWATKRRRPLITDHNREVIYACIVEKAGELNCYVHAINGMPDHVHVVIQLHPSVAVAKFVGLAKGSSSHLASRLGGDGTGEPFAWQDEYGALTVSERHLPIVVRYVERQQEHHAADTTNRMLELVEMTAG